MLFYSCIRLFKMVISVGENMSSFSRLFFLTCQISVVFFPPPLPRLEGTLFPLGTEIG